MKNASSRALGCALLALVAVVHFGYEPVADWLYPDVRDRAVRALFYIFRGVEGFALYVVLLAISRRNLPIAAACCWGALENAQTAVCRAAIGIRGDAVAGPYSGLCDVVSGAPVYCLTAFAALVVAAVCQESINAKG